MPFDGFGAFIRLRNWIADATAGVKIRADFHDDEDNNFADGLSHCIVKDGQTTITQNIPWNSKRITALADPIDPQDAATKHYVDVQDAATHDTTLQDAKDYTDSVVPHLTASLDYYVNGNTGDDAFDGSQAAVGTAPAGPFKTLQKASDVVAKYNLNGFNVTVHVADAQNYRQCKLPAVAGQGSVLWQGNKTNPSACLVSCGDNTTPEACFIAQGVNNVLSGFKLVGNLGTYGSGITVPAASLLIIDNIDWGTCNGTHTLVYNGGALRLNGLPADIFRVSGPPLGNTYAAACWLQCFAASRVDVVNISAPPQFFMINTPMNFAASFVQASDVGTVFLLFTNGFVNGNVCSGKKYDARANGVINTAGSGANYLPGSIAGTQLSGGQYV